MGNIYGDWNHEQAVLRTREREQAILVPTINFFDDPEKLGLQDRQGQAVMSIDIAEAIAKNHHIMAEAGAGIGKSFAYLIPALFAVQKFDQSVVIATDSMVLSQQLVGDAEQAKLLTGIVAPTVVVDQGPVINTAGGAKIIISNQELLIRHLLKKSSQGQGLKKDNTFLYIIDEAHKLEENARSALTTKWTMQGLKLIERALQQAIPKNATRRAQVENLRKVGEYRTQFFSHVSNQIKGIRSSLCNDRDVQRMWLPNKHIVNYNEWGKGLEQVIKACSSPLPEGTLALPQFIRRLWQYANSSYLVWLEGNIEDPYDLAICTAPKKINNELEKLLFSQSIPVVLMSDTLCSPQGSKPRRYRHYAESVGFPEDNSEFCDVQPSIFNYNDNGLLYIPNDLPRPDDENNREVYLVAIADRIAELITLSAGRTLVLFTALEDMQAVHMLLTSKELPYSLLLAEGSISQQRIDQFVASTGVLLATGDYWEGVHRFGSILSSLIIVQLPFPAFDPIIDYKISQVVDPMEILLPEMLTRLRQGVGRLIQTDTDTGVLSILDARLSDRCKRPYQAEVLMALPIRNRVSSLLEVEAFIHNTVKE